MAPRLSEKALTRAHAGEAAGALLPADKSADKSSAPRLAPSKIPTPCRARPRAVTQPAAATAPTPTQVKSEPSAPVLPEVPAQRGVIETSVRPKPDKDGYPVWLHVYDLGPVSKWVLNSWSSEGAFHCGIDVLGVEFSFQAISALTEDDRTTSGLTWHHPKSHPRHVYRESISMGSSPMRVADIGKLLEQLEKVWLARDYHCLRKNCTDFAQTLCQALKVPESFPEWVHGVAKGFLKPAGSADLSYFPKGICSSWSGTSSHSVSGATVDQCEQSQTTERKADPSARASPSMSCPPPLDVAEEVCIPAGGQRMLCGGTLCFMAS